MAKFRRNSGENRKGRNRYQQGYVPPRQVEHYWKIYRKGTYLEKPSRQGPGWIIPLLAFLLIMFLVFWAVPLAISRIQAADNRQEVTDPTVIQTVYDLNTYVCRLPVADVYDRPDLKANRITQILFNEPVTVLPEQDMFGYKKIRLDDGTEGYTLTENLVDDRTSVEPGFYDYKLVVASTVKRVMSHASRGTLLAEVMMGTVLFADYQGDSIFRVTLPDGSQGWVSTDGMIILETDAEIQAPADPERYFINSVLEFSRVTVLNNGLTVRGATVNGVARVAGLVNGVNLPRQLEDQFHAGTVIYQKNQSEIQTPHQTDEDLDESEARHEQPADDEDQNGGSNGTEAAENEAGSAADQLDFDVLVVGDLLFFADAEDGSLPHTMGIFIGGSEMLYARRSDSSISIVDLGQADQSLLIDRLISVRRVF